MTTAIGIDFGTSHASIGYWGRDGARIIQNEYYNATIPCVVGFRNNRYSVGEIDTVDSKFAVFGAKRLIGRKRSSDSVKTFMELMPFEVKSGHNDDAVISITSDGKTTTFLPAHVCSWVLMKLKLLAEAHLGVPVDSAVISVPTNYNHLQRMWIWEAADQVGIKVLDFVTDPMAAAVASAVQDRQLLMSREIVLVFDLGGGSLDIAVIAVDSGNFHVMGSATDLDLGGEDFLRRVMEDCIAEFHRKHGPNLRRRENNDMRNDPKALRRLRAACERVVRLLVQYDHAAVNVDCLFQGLDFYHTLTRAKFSKLNYDLFKKCMDHVRRCLQVAQVERSSIDRVLLVGGSSRIHMIQQLLQQCVGVRPVMRHLTEDGARGAAVHAAKLTGHPSDMIQRICIVESLPRFHDLESRCVTGVLKMLGEKGGRCGRH